MNTDALTDANNLGQFVSGKAAMTTDDGSWDVGQFTQQMRRNVGAMRAAVLGHTSARCRLLPR